MAVVCHSHNLLFIQNPRTASSAIGRHLVNAYGGKYIPRDESKPGGFHKHASLKDIVSTGTFNRRQLKAFLKFAGVRNPFDSIASLYQKRLNWSRVSPERREQLWWGKRKAVLRQVEFAARHSFEEFLIHFIDCQDRPPLMSRAKGVDMLVRFERVNQDFAEVLRHAGVETPLPVPIRNPTARRSVYQDYYSARAREIVERVYREELEEYGYSFDGPR